MRRGRVPCASIRLGRFSRAHFSFSLLSLGVDFTVPLPNATVDILEFVYRRWVPTWVASSLYRSKPVGGLKRISPEPAMDNGDGGKALKKAKMPRKKKTRDPNEPQK